MLQVHVAALIVLFAASGGSSLSHTIGVNMFVIEGLYHNNAIIQRLY